MTLFILSFFKNNWIEIFGTIAGIIYIFLSIKQNIWLWPVGFISSLLSLIVFLHTKLYADLLLQVYYLIISIYGFIHWWGRKKNTTNNNNQQFFLPITSISLKYITLLITIWFITTITMYYTLILYTDASVPFCDSLVTSGSLVATFMLAQKQIENWLLWIVVDFISMFLFFYKELYFFAALFLLYTFLAFIGYFEWKKILKQQLK